VAAHWFRVLIAAVDAVALTEDPAEDVVTASVDAFRRVALEHPALYGVVFLRTVPELDGEADGRWGREYTEQADEAFGRLERLLARVGDAGDLGKLTAAEAARAVHALTEGLAVIELRDEPAPNGKPDASRHFWEYSIRSLVHGFATT
jgi:Tetracyclin repressor-like, C-terminal domain